MATPSQDAFLANWKNSDLPFLQKLAVTMRNQAIKIATGSSCCGHHGEPGCWIGPDAEPGSGSLNHHHHHE